MKKMDEASSAIAGIGIGLFLISRNLGRYFFDPKNLGLTYIALAAGVAIVAFCVYLFFKSNRNPQHNLGYGAIDLGLAAIVALSQWMNFKMGYYNWMTVGLSIASIVFLLAAGLGQLRKH